MVEIGLKTPSPTTYPFKDIVKPKEVFECYAKQSVIDFVFQGLKVLKI